MQTEIDQHDRADERRESRRSNPARGYTPLPVAGRRHKAAPCLLHAYPGTTRVCPVCTAAAAERKAWRDSLVPRPTAAEISEARWRERSSKVIALLGAHGAMTAREVKLALAWSGQTARYVLAAMTRVGAIVSGHELRGNGHRERVYRLPGSA